MRLVGVVSVALVASTLVVTLLNLAAAKVDEVTVHDRQADACGRACERVTMTKRRDAPPHAFTCPLRLDVSPADTRLPSGSDHQSSPGPDRCAG